jgi:hypothetical protein
MARRNSRIVNSGLAGILRAACTGPEPRRSPGDPAFARGRFELHQAGQQPQTTIWSRVPNARPFPSFPRSPSRPPSVCVSPPITAHRRPFRDDLWFRPSLKPCGELPRRRVAFGHLQANVSPILCATIPPQNSQLPSRSRHVTNANLWLILRPRPGGKLRPLSILTRKDHPAKCIPTSSPADLRGRLAT